MSRHKNILESLLLVFLLKSSTCTDTITLTRPVKDGDVLISKGENFALGFFSPNNSSNRYVGIWYNKVSDQTVVWVANRDDPITNSSHVLLSIDETGNLVLHDKSKRFVFWSTNVSAVVDHNCSGQITNSGNLVLFQDQTIAWQSFDHPTNTLLPGMKLGWDRKTGLNRGLTSWKGSADPGTGEYSYKMEFVGSTQLFLNKGLNRVWRTGTWTGHGWSGVPEMTPNFIFNVTFIDNNDEKTVVNTIRNLSIFSRMVVNESGIVERMTWHEEARRWVGFWYAPKEQCDEYNHCGPFGMCDSSKLDEFECRCLPGFSPRLARDWYLRDGAGGCVRDPGARICGPGDGFVEFTRVKVPDTAVARVNMSLGLRECEELCLRNCSCLGYASGDISGGGRGCINWHGNMSDMRQFSDRGQSLFIRVDAAELARQSSMKSKNKNKTRILAIGMPLIAAVFLISAFICCYFHKKRVKQRKNKDIFSFKSLDGASMEKDMSENTDLHVFELTTIVAATEHFSHSNKLGEGGFGSVYKGKLQNGQEIAVKRLSITSGQGMEEFKNEVTLIAKLQHRNLVRLLGYCVEKDEKMLIYEYMPNKGLDTFIFDKEKRFSLDWEKRYEIILGIVRGLLYLHQDSRLKIIHRDMKASNVLLDAALNPKISDFGMAKIFGSDQDEAKTRRVVGTYGYMSPEYAMEGLFSVKSDVFSFGVLLLEIISGRKNNSYYLENSVNLIGHVWDLWKRNQILNIVDSSLGESYETARILACIQVGLLCVQESAIDRPTMSQVAFMLCNETKLPPPNQPAFIFGKSNNATDSTQSASASIGVGSVFDETITVVEPR